MVQAIWNNKINKARSLNATNAVNTISFYDLVAFNLDKWRVVTAKPTNNSDQEFHRKMQYHVYFAPMTIEIGHSLSSKRLASHLRKFTLYPPLPLSVHAVEFASIILASNLKQMCPPLMTCTHL